MMQTDLTQMSDEQLLAQVGEQYGVACRDAELSEIAEADRNLDRIYAELIRRLTELRERAEKAEAEAKRYREEAMAARAVANIERQMETGVGDMAEAERLMGLHVIAKATLTDIRSTNEQAEKQEVKG